MKIKRKTILLVLAVVLVVLQFFRPAKNESNVQTHHISTKYPLPPAVEAILQPACYDCHSNLTRYPWYTSIQPVGLWMASHVKGGKQHLNFSEFTQRRIAWQNHKFEEIIEMVDKKSMPIGSYKLTHADARLTDAQRKTLTDWAKSMMDTLKANYPADSLVMRRR